MPSSTSVSRAAALALTLAIFASVERAIWTSENVARYLLRHEPAAASGDTLGVASRILLMEPGGALPLVLLGSSQVREGLDCEILSPSPETASCVNLGIGGGSPLDMLFISRELGNRPRTVVVSLFPGIVSKAPKSGFIGARTIRAAAASGVLSRLTPDDWRLVGSGLLQAFSPTLRHREALRDAFKEGRLGGTDMKAGGGIPAVRRTSDRDRKPPEYFANRIGRIDPDFALSRFAPTQDLALEWLILGEVGAGHRVIVVDFPTRPGFDTTLGEGARAHYANLLERLRSRRDIRFVEARSLGPLGENDFIDFTHVDSNGRRLVSERLRDLLGP